MKELVRYLIDHMYLDFQGDVTMETVRNFLREDDSREARALLNKLIEEKGVEEMLITLADCLRESIRTGVTEEDIREQLGTYSDSLATRRAQPSRPAEPPGSPWPRSSPATAPRPRPSGPPRSRSSRASPRPKNRACRSTGPSACASIASCAPTRSLAKACVSLAASSTR